MIDGFQESSSPYVSIPIFCTDNVRVAFLPLHSYRHLCVPLAGDVVLHPYLLVRMKLRVVGCVCISIAFGFSRHSVSSFS